MKKITYAVLFLFLMVSLTYGATKITTSTLHPKYNTTLVTSYGTPTAPIGNDKDNRMYYIQVPCTTATDTFYTWGFDISEYQAISVHYYCTTGDSSTDSTVSLKFGYEQSPLPTSLFAAPPYAAGLLESDFTDSTGAASIQNITPAATQYLRLYIISSATHNIAEDGIFHIRATFLKSPISAFHQGGLLQASRIQIPNPYTSDVYTDIYWREGVDTSVAVADTFAVQLVNATVTSQRIAMDGSVDFRKPLRTEDLLVIQDAYAKFSLGDVTELTVPVAAGDSIQPTRSFHMLNIATGDSACIKRFGDPNIGVEYFVKGSHLLLRPAFVSATKKIIFLAGADSASTSGPNLLMDANFTMGLGDMIEFVKVAGDAHEAGLWARLTQSDNRTGP